MTHLQVKVQCRKKNSSQCQAKFMTPKAHKKVNLELNTGMIFLALKTKKHFQIW